MKSETFRIFLYNTIAFALVIGLGSTYLALGVFRIHPGQKLTILSLQVADTNMVQPGTGVFVNGLRIGKVSSIGPNAHGALMVLEYPRSQRIPQNTQISVGSQSALGEPYIDFEPQTEKGPYLESGARIDGRFVQQPDSIPQIFSSITGLTKIFESGATAGLLKTLSEAFAGNQRQFENLADGAQDISRLVNSRSARLEQLFRDTQRYTPKLEPVVRGLPTLSSGVGNLLIALRGVTDSLATLVDSNTYKQLTQSIHPFLARINPYLKEILPNVRDAVGPLLPVATAFSDLQPQINISKLLSQLLAIFSPDGAVRLTVSVPPR